MEPIPTIGQIVHYYPRQPDDGSELRRDQQGPFAAIITEVHSNTVVNLGVFSKQGHLYSATSVIHLETNPRHVQHWSWLPIV